MAIEIVDLEDECIRPISRQGLNKKDPISVELYAQERDLRLAIVASLSPPTQVIDLSQDEYNDDEVQILHFKPSPSKAPFEMGESSNSKPESFMCEICVEPKSPEESFCVKDCTHSYCVECIGKYIGSKLQDNVTCIQCPVPDCPGRLEPEYCHDILPFEVFERWGNALCESVILGSQKFYCPFKDCSVLLINDDEHESGEEAITQSECPNCWRLFCAKCKVPWHSGIDCAAFQNLSKDEREKEDIMLMQLAEDKKWKRCPKCKFYVERSDGCFYMKCRCGYAFCYNCGAQSTTTSHLCAKCRH